MAHARLVRAVDTMGTLATAIMPRARATLDAAEARYAAGDAMLAETLLARRDWIALRLEVVEAQREWLAARAALSAFQKEAYP